MTAFYWDRRCRTYLQVFAPDAEAEARSWRKAQGGSMKLTQKLVLVLEPDGDGYHLYCPRLSGLHAGGKAIEDTLANGGTALEAYLESLQKHGDPLPLDPDGA